MSFLQVDVGIIEAPSPFYTSQFPMNDEERSDPIKSLRTSTYQLTKMWLLLPGGDPSLVSRVDILLVPGLCRVLSPGGGLRSRGGVVACGVGPWVGPTVPPHHPYTTLHGRTSLALRQLQLLYLLLLLLLGLPVSNEPHLDISVPD